MNRYSRKAREPFSLVPTFSFTPWDGTVDAASGLPIQSVHTTHPQNAIISEALDGLKAFGPGKVEIQVWGQDPDDALVQVQCFGTTLDQSTNILDMLMGGLPVAGNPTVDDDPPPSSQPPGTPGTPVIAQLAVAA